MSRQGPCPSPHPRNLNFLISGLNLDETFGLLLPGRVTFSANWVTESLMRFTIPETTLVFAPIDKALPYGGPESQAIGSSVRRWTDDRRRQWTASGMVSRCRGRDSGRQGFTGQQHQPVPRRQLLECYYTGCLGPVQILAKRSKTKGRFVKGPTRGLLQRRLNAGRSRQPSSSPPLADHRGKCLERCGKFIRRIIG